MEAAGLIDVLPIDSFGDNRIIHIAGQPPNPPNQVMLAESRFVSAGYFNVMGIPLHEGRQLSQSLDRPENKGSTVVVNDAFVRKFIPRQLDPTTQRMDDNVKEEEWSRIVGVTGNVQQSIYEPPMAEMDYLMDEVPAKYKADLMSTMFLVVRTAGDPMQVASTVRSVVHDLDPTVPFDEPRTMTDVIAESLVFERMESWLFGIFASLALALAMVGLYGLRSIAQKHPRHGSQPRRMDARGGHGCGHGADSCRSQGNRHGDLLRSAEGGWGLPSAGFAAGGCGTDCGTDSGHARRID